VFNDNSCADTNDNVYLLSREEVTDWNYGFNTVEDRLGGLYRITLEQTDAI
jgi:hypothetical protein